MTENNFTPQVRVYCETLAAQIVMLTSSQPIFHCLLEFPKHQVRQVMEVTST